MIEIVIVVLIIGILLAAGLPSYYRSMERAQCRVAISTLTTMASAAWDFYAENDTFDFTLIPRLTPMEVINRQVGSSIIDNNDWTFVPVGNASGFTVTATRQRGPHAAAGNTTITLDQDDVWTGAPAPGGYPYKTPGTW